ncbi:MAG: ATP-binding protein [Polaromonas sp.]|uniref:ATP-binding protein n=1 Tax=Polaromonas sp. TaxID=1869339 RepID=UPI0040357E76
MLSSWGLRSRLALLAAMALLPVLGLLAWMASSNRQDAVLQAQARLQSQTLLLAANQQPLVDAARQMLGDMALSPLIRAGQRSGCADYLRRLQAQQPAYAELGVVGPDGVLLCHSQAAEAGSRAGHAELIAGALASRQLVIGGHGSERGSGKAGLGFALPVYDAGDVLRAVVFTLVDLQAFGAVLSMAALPVGTRAVLLDRRGVVLAVHPPDLERLGSLQTDPAIRAFRSAAQAGVGQAPDADGEPRLYAYAPVPGAAQEALFVALSEPRARVVAASRQAFLADLALLLFTAVFGMACAWWIGQRLIIRPAHAILREANELAMGNLAARVEVGPAYRGELGHLARTFNRMADSLQLRRGELDAALAHIGKEHRLLDLIINNMSEGVLAIDVHGRFLLFNAAARKTFPVNEAGLSLAEWRADHEVVLADGKTICPPQDRPLSRAVRGEAIDNWDVFLRRPGVRDRVLRNNIRPLRDGSGQLVGGLVVFTDITDRQLADLELRRTHRALQMLSRCNEALTRIDDETALLMQVCRVAVDVGGYRMAWVGYAQDDAARTIVPMAHAGQEGGYLSSIALSWDPAHETGRGPAGQTIRSGEARLSEDITRGDNQFFWSEKALQQGYRSAVFLPLRDAHRTFGLLGLYSASVEKLAAEELTLLQELVDNLAFGIGNIRARLERKQAQQEILRLNAELEERVRQRTAQLETANRELEAFSYSVSHDLRTPLSAIDGFSGLLARDIGAGDLPGARASHYLNRIRAGIAQMGELIDALLSLAQVSRTSLRMDSVNLSVLADRLVGSYRERDPGRLVEVQIEPQLWVQGDARLLQQVLDNLLGNAWKFSKRQPQARISFGRAPLAQEGAPAVYVVRDNGAGFDMAYAEKLFGAFQRLHTVTEFEGTGIGLATVQRIVMRHGGRVWGESAPGQGAAFYFSLGAVPSPTDAG